MGTWPGLAVQYPLSHFIHMGQPPYQSSRNRAVPELSRVSRRWALKKREANVAIFGGPRGVGPTLPGLLGCPGLAYGERKL